MQPSAYAFRISCRIMRAACRHPPPMTDPVAFVLSVIALLAVPGPTNTLLATAGGLGGVRRAIALIPAEVAGYLLAIGVITVDPHVARVRHDAAQSQGRRVRARHHPAPRRAVAAASAALCRRVRRAAR